MIHTAAVHFCIIVKRKREKKKEKRSVPSIGEGGNWEKRGIFGFFEKETRGEGWRNLFLEKKKRGGRGKGKKKSLRRDGDVRKRRKGEDRKYEPLTVSLLSNSRGGEEKKDG